MKKSNITLRHTHNPFQEAEALATGMLRDFSFTPSIFSRKVNGEDFYPMRVDFADLDGAYCLTTEVPGVDKDDIDITIEDNMLIISGEKRLENEDKQDNYHRIERSYGSFYRKMPLPGDANASEITADVKKGILTLNIPKSAKDKNTVHKIKVS